MPRFHDIEQNTDEWMELRCGLLGSSSLACVMANYGKAFGDPAKRLAVNLAVEQLTGRRSQSGYKNDDMLRGHEQEPIAKALYEERYFCEVSNGGFFENGRNGCSPDGLVYDDGLIEIKSVIANIQYDYIKKGGIQYKWQCYGNLKLTERSWLEFVSYCADFPEGNQLYTHRIYPDYEIFGQIDNRVSEFFELVEKAKDNIIKYGEMNNGA